jgi:hypothetical protein
MQEAIEATGEAAPAVEIIPTNDDTPISAHQAARSLAQHRYKRDAQEQRAEQEPERPIPSQEDLAAASAQEPAAETTTEQPEPDSPPIEPPRSWSKEWKEEFATYPPVVQEKIAQREQERDTAIRRGQNELAEQRKANDAERQQLEQARKQYEDTLPQLLAGLQRSQQGEFSDIKTIEDVQRLAREDWPRYALWDAHQKQVAAVQQEMQANQQRQAQDYQSQWSKFVDVETKAFLETAPELSTSESQTKFANDVRDYYKDIGYSNEEITKLIGGQASVSPHDRRQLAMVRDALAYRQAKAAVPKAKVVPIAKVQRPGTPAERASDKDTRLSALDKRLNERGNWRDGAELLMARRGR